MNRDFLSVSELLRVARRNATERGEGLCGLPLVPTWAGGSGRALLLGAPKGPHKPPWRSSEHCTYPLLFSKLLVFALKCLVCISVKFEKIREIHGQWLIGPHFKFELQIILPLLLIAFYFCLFVCLFTSQDKGEHIPMFLLYQTLGYLFGTSNITSSLHQSFGL